MFIRMKKDPLKEQLFAFFFSFSLTFLFTTLLTYDLVTYIHDDDALLRFDLLMSERGMIMLIFVLAYFLLTSRDSESRWNECSE